MVECIRFDTTSLHFSAILSKGMQGIGTTTIGAAIAAVLVVTGSGILLYMSAGIWGGEH